MNPIEFARNLFTLRMEHKMTAEELAEALGVTEETVCAWECAKTSPSLDQMNRLAKVYGIPLDQVIRNPRPVASPETPVPEPIPEPVPEEPAPEPVATEEPAAEPQPEPRAKRKKERNRVAEAIVLLILLGIITAATLLLVKPEWLPWWN